MNQQKSQVVPLILAQDLFQLAPVIFGFALAWDPYVDEVESRCREVLRSGTEPVIVLVDSDRFLAWCAAHGADPRGSETLSRFAELQAASGAGTTYQSDLRAISRTAEVVKELHRVATFTYGPQSVLEVLRRLFAYADDLVSVLEDCLPTGGRIRVTQMKGMHSSARVCDVVSSTIDDDPVFPGDLYPLVQAELALTHLVSGILVAECSIEGQWGYMMWTLDADGWVPLAAADAMLNAMQEPGLLSPGIDTRLCTDAWEVLPGDEDEISR